MSALPGSCRNVGKPVAIAAVMAAVLMATNVVALLWSMLWASQYYSWTCGHCRAEVVSWPSLGRSYARVGHSYRRADHCWRMTGPPVWTFWNWLGMLIHRGDGAAAFANARCTSNSTPAGLMSAFLLEQGSVHASAYESLQQNALRPILVDLERQGSAIGSEQPADNDVRSRLEMIRALLREMEQ